MNKCILARTSFSIFLVSLQQLMGMHSFNQEQHQRRLNEQLIEAAKAANTDTVISLLKQGADINHSRDSEDQTSLLCAAWYGHAEVVKILIEHNANPNDTTYDGSTALMRAAIKGRADIIRLLIEAHADVNQVDNNGFIALVYAAWKGYVEIVKMLIEHDANINHITNTGLTALMAAIKEHKEAVVELLIRYGAIVPPALSAEDRRDMALALTESGFSPMAQAIITRDTNTIKNLLKKEPSKKTKISSKGKSPLLNCAAVNTRDKFGMTALHWAAAQNYSEFIKRLLNEYNLDMAVQDNEGNTPLHIAARNGNEFVLWLLLNHGVCIDAVNNNGNTALHLAAQAGRTTTFKFLLRGGAQVTIPNHNGQTAWSIAVRANRDEIANLIERNAARATLRCVSRNGKQGCLGMLYTNNNANGTAQPLGILPAEITDLIARYAISPRLPAT